MSPSFSSKNGVRYRFYISTALRGRKDRAGSVTRVSALEIERTIEDALLSKLEEQGASAGQLWDRVERAVVAAKNIRVSWKAAGGTATEVVDIPRAFEKPHLHNNSSLIPAREPNEKLLWALARAHAWLPELSNNHRASVEELARQADIHPKVMREALKMAFLAPDIVASIFTGEASFQLSDLRNVSALGWQSQRNELRQTR